MAVQEQSPHWLESQSRDVLSPTETPPTTIIRPMSGWIPINIYELWEYRELLYFLIWRDITVRYKQTAIGAAWAIVQPFATMVVFTLIFGGLLQVSSDGVPYPVFVYCALVPWNFFAAALARSGNSLVYDANLISKIYFPRLIVPLAAVLSMVIDFAIAFAILLGMMLFYRIIPTMAILTLPFFLLLALMTALAFGLWLSTLNVRYRDIAYVIPFLIQFWLFLTPVAYSSKLIPEGWRTLYSLNPMTGVIEGFRWALVGTQPMPSELILVSAIVVVILLIGGLFYFRRVEDEFADVV